MTNDTPFIIQIFSIFLLTINFILGVSFGFLLLLISLPFIFISIILLIFCYGGFKLAQTSANEAYRIKHRLDNDS